LPDPSPPNHIQKMAEEIYEVWTLSAIGTHEHGEKDEFDLSDSEMLTLHILTKKPSLNVGELQRFLGVSPTKMSRIVRRLERQTSRPLVKCEFNPDDRRKVDVSITETGKQAYQAYRSLRVARTLAVLTEMDEAGRADFVRVIRMLRRQLLPNDTSDDA